MEETHANATEIESRVEAIRRRYPDRFDDDQIEQIRKRVERTMAQADALRDHSLGNSVGPEFHPRTMVAVNPRE